MHGQAGPAELQEALVCGLCKLAKRKRRDARAYRLRIFAISTSELTRQAYDASKKGCTGQQARSNCKKHQ
ncbi:hypothetical protein CDL15_Pgr020698 [Punica granatum]|uniref:Uncharacterized protein n=1 Tax=Punica granatum TaxID=22663 RepID=A0A218W8U3_PUNGR|nr:hypothetical protein CDL15_Pgr020698 [Punica granatum]